MVWECGHVLEISRPRQRETIKDSRSEEQRCNTSFPKASDMLHTETSILEGAGTFNRVDEGKLEIANDKVVCSWRLKRTTFDRDHFLLTFPMLLLPAPVGKYG
jgi:hypothetical protein